jgi:hypothetical protein
MSFDFAIGPSGALAEFQSPVRAISLSAPIALISHFSRVLLIGDSQTLQAVAKISYGRLRPWGFWGRRGESERRRPGPRSGRGSLLYAV